MQHIFLRNCQEKKKVRVPNLKIGRIKEEKIVKRSSRDEGGREDKT